MLCCGPLVLGLLSYLISEECTHGKHVRSVCRVRAKWAAGCHPLTTPIDHIVAPRVISWIPHHASHCCRLLNHWATTSMPHYVYEQLLGNLVNLIYYIIIFIVISHGSITSETRKLLLLPLHQPSRYEYTNRTSVRPSKLSKRIHDHDYPSTSHPDKNTQTELVLGQLISLKRYKLLPLHQLSW